LLRPDGRYNDEDCVYDGEQERNEQVLFYL
jgi:hypothetical protein